MGKAQRERGKECDNWVDVYGFPQYEINELGQIRHKKFKRVRKTYTDSNGYYMVSMRGEDGKTHTKRIHVLMMMSFKPIRKKNFVVNHIDGDKKNNRLDNLEWCTLSDNQLHATRMGLRKDTVKVVCLDTMEIFDSYGSAARSIGVRESNVRNVCNGICSHTKGRHFAKLIDYKNNCIPLFIRKMRKVKVICIDDLKVYDSYGAAARSVGITNGGEIKKVCDGRYYSYKGKRFARLEDYENKCIPPFKGKWIKKVSNSL